MVSIVKSKRLQWSGHVARMGITRKHTEFERELKKCTLGRRRRWEDNY
jgi:hypothetical protein